MGVVLNIFLMEGKGPPCEFIVCYQRKFTMSDNNPRRHEFPPIPSSVISKSNGCKQSSCFSTSHCKIVCKGSEEWWAKTFTVVLPINNSIGVSFLCINVSFSSILNHGSRDKWKIKFWTFVSWADTPWTPEFQNLKDGVEIRCLVFKGKDMAFGFAFVYLS